MIVEALLKWIITAIKNNHLLMDYKLLSRDRKAYYKLRKAMEPLLNCTEVVMDFSKDEPITREVLFMFKNLQKAIRQSINNLDDIQIATAVKSVERTEADQLDWL